MISHREWRWVAAWAALALLLANVPTLLGWALSTPEMSFGGAVYNVEDVHSYLANMRQGWRGEWLYHNPYTPEEHPGSLIYLHYLLLGKIAALSGLSLEATYHLARVACGAALLIVVYHFLAQFTPHLAVRRVAFLLIAFSGGLGWLLIALGRGEWLGSLPLDLISPEGYVFLTLYSPPHIALATAGVLWGVGRVYGLEEGKGGRVEGWKGARGEKRRERGGRARVWGALAGGAAFAGVAVVGAFYLLVPFAMLCAYALVTALWQRRDNRRLWIAIGLAALPPALPAVYQATLFAVQPVYRAWAAQNQVRSPHPLHYAAGFAIPCTLALLGALHAVRHRQRRRWARWALPIVWVLLTPVLLYLPLNVQRRLILGAQVPLGLLAAWGLVAVVLALGRSRLVRRLPLASPSLGQDRARRYTERGGYGNPPYEAPGIGQDRARRCTERGGYGNPPYGAPGIGQVGARRYTRRGLRRLLIAAAILATVPTPLLLVAGTALQVARRAPPIYRPRAELAALDWLRANTSPRDTVLCAYETGNYIPARAGNRVVLGLGPQTVDVERKRDEVQRFFGGTEEEAWRRALLERYGVAYVLVGPNERALGRFDLGARPYLEKVYEEGGYALFRVVRVTHRAARVASLSSSSPRHRSCIRILVSLAFHA